MAGAFTLSFGFVPFWIAYRLTSWEKVPLRGKALVGVVLRGVINAIIYCLNFAAFSVGQQAGLNIGVIASVLTTAIFFTIILFYFFYGERLSLFDWIGTVIVFVGVFMIGFFHEEDPLKVEGVSNVRLAWLAIAMVLLVSFLIGATSVIQRYYVAECNFTPL